MHARIISGSDFQTIGLENRIPLLKGITGGHTCWRLCTGRQRASRYGTWRECSRDQGSPCLARLAKQPTLYRALLLLRAALQHEAPPGGEDFAGRAVDDDQRWVHPHLAMSHVSLGVKLAFVDADGAGKGQQLGSQGSAVPPGYWRVASARARRSERC